MAQQQATATPAPASASATSSQDSTRTDALDLDMQALHSGKPVYKSTPTFTAITFGDGTTQTTAASAVSFSSATSLDGVMISSFDVAAVQYATFTNISDGTTGVFFASTTYRVRCNVTAGGTNLSFFLWFGCAGNADFGLHYGNRGLAFTSSASGAFGEADNLGTGIILTPDNSSNRLAANKSLYVVTEFETVQNSTSTVYDNHIDGTLSSTVDGTTIGFYGRAAYIGTTCANKYHSILIGAGTNNSNAAPTGTPTWSGSCKLFQGQSHN